MRKNRNFQSTIRLSCPISRTSATRTSMKTKTYPFRFYLPPISSKRKTPSNQVHFLCATSEPIENNQCLVLVVCSTYMAPLFVLVQIMLPVFILLNVAFEYPYPIPLQALQGLQLFYVLLKAVGTRYKKQDLQMALYEIKPVLLSRRVVHVNNCQQHALPKQSHSCSRHFTPGHRNSIVTSSLTYSVVNVITN